MKINVALYLRVSTSEQSVEAQRMELTAYCASKGWAVAQTYEDVISGSKRDRAGLDALLEAVRRKEYGAVLVVKLDRMARSLAHFSQIVALFAEADVALVCTSQGIDTSKANACGRLQMAVLSAVAEFERDLIRERTRAGLAVARANGKALGRVSARMVGVDRAAVVGGWRSDGGTDYRELGRRLGGVSGATAWRVAKQYPATDEVLD